MATPRLSGTTYHDSPEGRDHQRLCWRGRRLGQVEADERAELRDEQRREPRQRRRSRLDDIWEGS